MFVTPKGAAIVFMKVVTFFNEKGGTGKSTFTALFACYLRYKKGCPVTVIDFDHPNYQLYSLRETDNRILQKEPNSALSRYVAANTVSPFKMIRAEAPGGKSYSQLHLEKMADTILSLKDKPGYLLLDFPGRFLISDPAYFFALKGIIDLFVMPVDSDRQSIVSALQIINNVFRDSDFIAATGRDHPQDVLILPNRENQKERVGKGDRYAIIEEGFRKKNIPVTGARMREILIARRDANTFGFIRNTLCWPQQNIDRACPYIELIFEEIKSRLDGTWELKFRK